MRDFDGQLSGLVTLTQLLAVPENRRDAARLSQVATPVAYLAFTTLDEPVTDLRARLPRWRHGGPDSLAARHTAGHALVLGPSGELAGLLTPADFARAAQSGACGRHRGRSRGDPADDQGAPRDHDAFHVPLWLWGVALAVVLAVVAADVLLASRSRGHEPGLREAALCTAGVVALGALFGVALATVAGPKASGQFYAGWLTEYSLSLDNLFVFVLLIGRSGMPARLRSRVLLAGIGLALLLRAVFIAAGAAALNRFDWVLYIFGAILLATAVRMAAGRAGPPDPASAGPSLPGPGRLRRGMTGRLKSHRHGALFALIAAIAGADVVFAMDSIPAVFGLTRDPYLVLAANVFALLGLRHLYFLIGGLLDRLVHLTAGLSAILAFIGVKLIAEALASSGVHRIGPVPVPHIDTWVSLCVIGGVLAVVTVTSLLATRHRGAGRSAPPGQGTQLSGHLVRATFRVSPVARSVSSTVPSASPRLPTVTRYGMPVSSASRNFTPARSARSSMITSNPAAPSWS